MAVMPAPKTLVRSLGLAWVALLATVAWEYTPQHAAAAATSPKLVASTPPAPVRPHTPSIKAPRVVYDGLVTGSSAQSRPTQQPLPVATVAAGESVPASAVVTEPTPVIRAPAKVAALVESTARPVPARSQRIDINTASAAELSAIGGGMIGRAIVGGRPYASPQDLLAKRVLNRATYARIADMVETR